MSEIRDRLREMAKCLIPVYMDGGGMREVVESAADEIDKLEAENARLRSADMFWDAENPEEQYSDLHDMAQEYGDGCHMEVWQGRRLPTIWISTHKGDGETIYREHHSEAEARAALEGEADD